MLSDLFNAYESKTFRESSSLSFKLNYEASTTLRFCAEKLVDSPASSLPSVFKGYCINLTALK